MVCRGVMVCKTREGVPAKVKGRSRVKGRKAEHKTIIKGPEQHEGLVLLIVIIMLNHLCKRVVSQQQTSRLNR